MSEVTFKGRRVRVGDRVKIRHLGLVSEDWMIVGEDRYIPVVRSDTGFGTWLLVSAEIIDHEPAPRKVEVILGEEIGHAGRFYKTALHDQGIQVSRSLDWGGVVISVLQGGRDGSDSVDYGARRIVHVETLRRLVADLLATLEAQGD